MPLAVQREAAAWEKEIGLRGTVALNEEAEIAVFERTREAAARLLGVRTDEIAILSSATLAIAEIAWWNDRAEGRTSSQSTLSSQAPPSLGFV